MKKKIFILMIFIILGSISFGLTNQEKANALKEMGILKGTDQGLQLDEEFTRAQGAIMLVRMLGAVDELQQKEYDHPFKDVPSWASNHVGYLFKNSLANGISSDTYGSDQAMRPNDYLTFVLRALNYDDSKGDFSWSNAIDKAGELNIIDSERREKYRNGIFLREDMADVTYNSLNTNMKDSNKILVDILKEKTTITNTVDVTTNTDNSISNTNNISNINNSEISITTDNSENSFNNSNNTVYDYSTTINNFIDNSITINNVSYNNLEDLLSKILGLDTRVSSDIIFNVQNQAGEPIEGAILYIDDEIKGLSNVQGIIGISDHYVLNDNFIKIRKEGYKQYFNKISFGKTKEYKVILIDSDQKVDKRTYLPSEAVYDAYGKTDESINTIYVWGSLLDFSKEDVVSFEIFDASAHQNIVEEWTIRHYGGHYGVQFLGFEVDYLNSQELKKSKIYSIQITKKDNSVIKTKLIPTDKPLILDFYPGSISTAENKVIIEYRLVDENDSISDIPFVIANEIGEIIYQEVKKVNVEKHKLIYFELINNNGLKSSKTLYTRPLYNDSVKIVTGEFDRVDTFDTPQIIFLDREGFKKSLEFSDGKVAFNLYGYNFKGDNIKANLMKEVNNSYQFVKELNYSIKLSDNGILNYFESSVSKEDLSSGEYHIMFPQYGNHWRFGTFYYNGN